MNIIYLHGLSSSGNSNTAMLLRELFPEDNVIPPDIPIDPKEALKMLRELAEGKTDLDTIFVGTSMGAMYAQQMVGYNRILINPAYHVSKLLRQYEGKTLPFFSQRQDGATEFLVTKELCEAYEEMEKHQFDEFASEDVVVALFGSHDEVCNCMKESAEHCSFYHVFDGGHRLTEQNVRNVLKPMIEWLKDFYLPESESQALRFEDVKPGDTGRMDGNDDIEHAFKIYKKGIGRKWFEAIKKEYNGQTMMDDRVFNLKFPELPDGHDEDNVELVLGNRFLCPPSVEYYGTNGIQVFDDTIFYISGLKIQVF